MNEVKAWFIKHFSDLLIAAIAILAPLEGMIITVILLIIFDFISGMAAAYHRGEKITSRKMSVTLSKFIFYNIGIFTMIGVEYLTLGVLPLVKFIGGIIAFIEMKSIFENISAILGIDFWVVIKEYLKRNQEAGKDFSSILDKEEKQKTKDENLN